MTTAATPPTAAVAVAKRLAAKTGSDYEGGKQIIMKSLGGIPLGRPAKAGRGRQLRRPILDHKTWRLADIGLLAAVEFRGLVLIFERHPP